MAEPGNAPVEAAPDVQLWQRWRRGERVDLGEFLAGRGDLGATELVAVLLVDQRERWQVGERTPAENYLRRFPALEADAEAVVELAYGEFLLREEREERPTLQEYLARFPGHGARLRQQVELHQALAAPAVVSSGANTVPITARAGEPGVPVVPGYEVLGELGRGGMGVVYRARQVKANRLVALKMLLAGGHAAADELGRFRSEAEAIARLQHPNIVSVYEVGEQGGLPFFSLEFCPGGGLDRKLGGMPLPPRQAAALAKQLALAVQAAHRQGIIHRDLKPANVLLSADGTPKIADFGLARKLDEAGQTQTGAVMGTASYMAPEQARGKTREVGPRADVYALGAILYECLTGRPPFRAATYADTVRQVLEQEPAAPRRLNSATPPDLETICLKCLHKDQAKRYASATDLADDLGRFLEDRPIRARRTPWHERSWRWCRRNPVVATLSGALLLVLAVAAAAGVLLNLNLSAALAQSRQAERDRKQQLFESLVSEAKAQRFSGRGGQRFGTLESIRKAADLARELEMPAATFDELRNLAIAALALPDLHKLKEWEDGWPEGSRGLFFDEALEHYARGDREGNFTVRRVADDAEVARRKEAPSVLLGGFAEGGRALVLHDTANHARKLWRFGAADAVSLGKQPEFFGDDLARITTADQQLLVTVNGKTGVLSVHELATGRRLHNISFGKWLAGPAEVEGVGWDMHPREHRLAVAAGPWHDAERHIVRVLDLDRGRVEKELVRTPVLPGQTYAGQLVWHPDGRTLAVAYPWDVVLWDVPTGKEVDRITDHKGGGLNVSISRSGQLLSTYSSWVGGVKFWHPYRGKLLLSLPGASVHPTGQTPDGRMYTSRIDGTRLQLWATEPSPVLRVLVRNPVRGRPVNTYGRSSAHKDGRLLAAGSSDGVSLFDLKSGLDVGHLDLGFTLTAQFDRASGDLLTFGTLGLLRWPVRAEPEHPDRLRVGPPKQLVQKPASDNQFRISDDGRTIVVAEYSRVLVLHADQLDRPVVLEPTVNVRGHISVSRDGQWVATGTHGGGELRLWEARTGRLLKTKRFPEGPCHVQFTPDGERLLVSGSGYNRYWRVGDWEELTPNNVGGFGDFTPDSQLIVQESNDGALLLLRIASGKEVIRLESPDQGRCQATNFTPDGSILITTNFDYPAIHVWDLQELSRRLKTMDLDWDSAANPVKEDHARLLPPLQVRVDEGDMGGAARKRQAARRLNDEAWLLVTGTPAKRDPARALELVQQALRDDPGNPTYLNTLGVVQYRNGLYKDAAASLEKSLAGHKGAFDAYDLFFLAMCHARLGDRTKAEDCFGRAVRWLSGKKDLDPVYGAELKTFRAEAEQVLRSP